MILLLLVLLALNACMIDYILRTGIKSIKGRRKLDRYSEAMMKAQMAYDPERVGGLKRAVGSSTSPTSKGVESAARSKPPKGLLLAACPEDDAYLMGNGQCPVCYRVYRPKPSGKPKSKPPKIKSKRVKPTDAYTLVAEEKYRRYKARLPNPYDYIETEGIDYKKERKLS